MSKLRPLVAGNWKMNGSLVENKTIIEGLLSSLQVSQALEENQVEVVIFPPAIYIPQVVTLTKGSGVLVGGQSISQEKEGAFTGDISAAMVKESGCKYVMLGHSERREYHGETDDEIAQQMVLALKSGLIPILCVGESLKEREGGEAERVIRKQLTTVIERVGINVLQSAVVAYEPIWAIGTGKTATPEEAEAIHRLIRSTIAKYDDKIASLIRILYGGSVNANNASSLFQQENINGALVGGASLKAEEFVKIITAYPYG